MSTRYLSSMSKIKLLALALSWFLTGGFLWAQTDTNFNFTIAPTNNAPMVEGSTNLLAVTITNLFYTTQEDTNTITNMIFTNVTVKATFPSGGSNVTVTLKDGGAAPDKTKDDGIFSGNLIAPDTDVLLPLTVTFTLIGDNLMYTNESGQQQTTSVTNTDTRTYRIIPRPVNDNFTNAVRIRDSVTSTNNYASREKDEPMHAKVASWDASVWWMWSSPVTTNVLIDTAGSSFNTILAVYTGTSLKLLTEVASATNNPVNNLKAYVQFQATAGTTYRIAVAGLDSNGVGNIRLRCVPGGTPDTRPPTVSITDPSRQTLVTSSNLMISGMAKDAGALDSGISNILVQVNSNPPTNAVGTDNWQVVLSVPPGTNIIRAYAVDYAGNVGSADSIVVRHLNPTNDFFADATVLTGMGGVATNVNGRATLEPDEPLHSGNAGGHSVWYSWRAPGTGNLQLSTSGSSFDTLLDVYVGTNVTNLVSVAYNDDAYQDSGYSDLTITVISNQLYYISVDGYGGAAGNITMTYAYTAPQPGQYYYLTTVANPGGSVFPPSGMYPAGSSVRLTATPTNGFEFVGWEGTFNVPNNPLTVSMSQDVSLSARFRVITSGNSNSVVTEDFESGDLKRLPWGSSISTVPWVVQTNSVAGGHYAARSAPTISDGQKSSLVLSTNMLAGVGSFDFRVSSEEGWDWLEFYLNGKLLQRWSGEINWTNYIFDVQAGTNRLEWRYAKDGSFKEGSDTAFIDNVYVPLGSASASGAAATVLVNKLPSGEVQLTILGAPNRLYAVEVSVDLAFWLPVAVKDSPTGVIQFLDSDAVHFPIRFYRAVAQ